MAIVTTLTEMLKSKKFVTAVGTTVVAATAKIGLELPLDSVIALILPLVTYILAQAGADFGKEAVKERQEVSG